MLAHSCFVNPFATQSYFTNPTQQVHFVGSAVIAQRGCALPHPDTSPSTIAHFLHNFYSFLLLFQVFRSRFDSRYVDWICAGFLVSVLYFVGCCFIIFIGMANFHYIIFVVVAS